MNYFEDLSKGSPAHTATRLAEGRFKIEPVDDSDESLIEFQEVVEEALFHFGEDGHEVKPHKSTRRSLPDWGTRPVYDAAFIQRVM